MGGDRDKGQYPYLVELLSVDHSAALPRPLVVDHSRSSQASPGKE